MDFWTRTEKLFESFSCDRKSSSVITSSVKTVHTFQTPQWVRSVATGLAQGPGIQAGSTCSSFCNVSLKWHQLMITGLRDSGANSGKGSSSRSLFRALPAPFPLFTGCHTGCLPQWELCLLTQQMGKTKAG